MPSSPSLPSPTPLSPEEPPFIVASQRMRDCMRMAERVARHPGAVLIVGETGTGKERVARAIHTHSERNAQPFIEINCAALPEHLVESELFGYEKGAFSGADTAKPGLFEMAHRGTIFLDEIGELDPKVQGKLLRVLDGSPYYRLGGHRKILADARVVAATNRNLKEEVTAGRFRKDLYHRLSQFELAVPPLRERPDDIAALAEYFMAQGSGGRSFSPEAVRALQRHAWPGNVRELRNTVNKILFSTDSREISAAEIAGELTEREAEVVSPQEERRGEAGGESDIGARLDRLKAQAIEKALEKTNGHRGQAAAELGISRRTLSRKLRDYRLSSARRNAVPASSAGPSAGEEERRHFRAELRTDATLLSEGGEPWPCTTTDLSATGMGLAGVNASVGLVRRLRIRFRLPDVGTIVEMPVRLAWIDKQGAAGVSFPAADPAVLQHLKRWLDRRMAEDGWVLPDAPETLAVDFRASSSYAH